MRWLALALFGVLGLAGAAPDVQLVTPTGYSIWLVRHAEKLTDGDDPGLSASGEARAASLARWLETKGVRAIWSTDTRRTRATAQPLADALGIKVQLYDPSDALAMDRKLETAALNALVVGHSNTIPGLASLICACAAEPMDESEYNRLIAITVAGDGAFMQVMNQDLLFEPVVLAPGGD